MSIALLTKHVSLNGLIDVSQYEMFKNLVFHLNNKIEWMVLTRNYIIMIAILVIISGSYFGYRLLADHTIDELSGVEIDEYEGQKLSSIGDFRENSINGPQYIDPQSYRLTVTGLVFRNITYTYDDIIVQHQLYEKVVTLHCVEGWDVTILWEGVLVKDLLGEAGIDPRAKVVIFYAHDGYSTSFPLDFIVNDQIIMAHKMNGVVLPPQRGFPFQLVAESKWGYKWIKWITKIEVSDDINYRGYWESRGYSNDAKQDEPFTG